TPFTGTSTGFVYPKHVLEAGDDAYKEFISNPTGTGPYKGESFTPNDQGTFVINENYREPNTPFFSTVNIQAGGDAPAAARAVSEPGESQYARNLPVESRVLLVVLAPVEPGKLTPYPGDAVERVNVHSPLPNEAVHGQPPEMNT